jgi:alkylation response protein AidB-like acyl-CoA dehydrogenase
MPGYELTPQQQEFVATIASTARDRLLDLTGATAGSVNRPLIRAMGEHGLLARLFGTEGTNSAAAFDLCLLRETLAAITPEAETALGLQGLGSYPILLAGSPELIQEWIPGVAAGEVVPAYALTEPDAGSDAAGLALEARPDGNGWRLFGEKCWISNAPEADIYTVFARTTPGARARGVTAFAVPAGRPGLGGEYLDMITPHPIGSVTFDAVPVGPADVLGEVDHGFGIAMRTLDVFRPSVGAFAVGMAQAALDAAVDHAATRGAFGGVLADKQAVEHMLADVATRVEASRMLVYRAAALYDAGGDPAEISRRSAMAKLYATETAQYAVDTAVQLHGARALQRGHPLEHLYREVRAPRIYEGASEVQRTIIGRSLIRARRADNCS